MLQSKNLKEEHSESKRPSKLYIWWIDTWVADQYYHYSWKFFGNLLFQLKRMIQWYWNVFRFDYDFDGHCLYAIIEYKLKRILPVLLNGHSIQEEQDIKALKLAIKLAGRLKEDNYENVAYERVEKKWGKLRMWSIPSPDSNGFLHCHTKYDKVTTPADEEKCRSDRTNTYLMADVRCKREEKWLYGILHKYLRRWWD